MIVYPNDWRSSLTLSGGWRTLTPPHKGKRIVSRTGSVSMVKSPTRQLHDCIPVAVSGGWHVENTPFHSTLSPTRKNARKVPKPEAILFFFVGYSSPSCDSLNSSRRFALRASNAFLVGVYPRRGLSRHCRVARVYGVIGLRPCMVMSTAPRHGRRLAMTL